MSYLLMFSEKKINRGFKNVYKTDADEEERTVIKIDRRAASVVDETRFVIERIKPLITHSGLKSHSGLNLDKFLINSIN